MSKEDKTDQKAVKAGVGVVTNAKVKDEEQPKLPWMVSSAMFLAPLCWYGPIGSTRSVLIPQLFAQLDPVHKVWAVGILATVASITGAVANLLFGAFSDVTRTRFGKRKPYIVVGTIAIAISLVVIANVKSIMAIILIWIVAAAAENAIAAAIYPQISDRVAPKWRGTVSTFYGVGFTIAQQGFALLAAQFLGNVKMGIYFMAGSTVVLAIIHLLLIQEKGNMDEPKVSLNKDTLKKYFFFPTHDARDFYLALTGKFFMVVGSTIVTTFLLFLFTDYIGQGTSEAGKSISIFSSIMLIIGVIFALIGGPLADKLNRVKAPVVIATFALGFAALFPLFVQKPWAMFVYAVIAAFGNGLYNSVDGALNMDVLPSSDTAGKDLGLINLANTLGQMLGAMVASAIVAAFGYGAIFIFAIAMELVGGIAIAMIKRVR
ncbi:MFS transporter [Levilactobacillus parabrevis]|uniref:Major facilitator superfamily protein n=1 Tax=Levilactobacillus parabrevis ATCC 53295 TaxID=1267003 RepID=A0A0R1GTB3_9LACO|nr:MFS transporter [Levilactobacillus parabrevis]KRK37199.1 major facilitator superfamily protein [Levilactobacillus parabrevis ATCC 53295]KRO06305.1 major facilitator superfamily protein [Levilactobacillus parabrevis]MCT4486487.1 MFS transporter [Levilactobacillus parabrevis]MCT4489888.1 MFS transporter [Levilactobacillus parabrevis]